MEEKEKTITIAKAGGVDVTAKAEERRLQVITFKVQAKGLPIKNV